MSEGLITFNHFLQLLDNMDRTLKLLKRENNIYFSMVATNFSKQIEWRVKNFKPSTKNEEHEIEARIFEIEGVSFDNLNTYKITTRFKKAILNLFFTVVKKITGIERPSKKIKKILKNYEFDVNKYI